MKLLEFPISIGLFGAPGSGKQKLVDAFYEVSKDYFAENESPLMVIENAGTTIARLDDQALGIFGSYADDLRAYHIRHEEELHHKREGSSYITLGTAIENIAHCGVNLETIMTGLATPDQPIKVQQWQVTMTQLSLLFRAHLSYTFGFYLPHPGTSIILPGEPDTESEYNQRIDKAIQAIFANFGMRIQALDQPTMEEKAEVMLETVKRIMENGPDPIPVEEAGLEEVPSPEDDNVELGAQLPD